MGTRATRLRSVRTRELRALVRRVATAAREHRLTTHAAAIAFRLLVGLVPLILLGLALLGAFGLEDVWRDSIAPELEKRFTKPVYTALDASAQEIFEHPKGGLIAFAALLLLWEATRGVRAVSNALNEIHEVEERRPWWGLTLVTLGLAVAVSLLTVASTLIVIVAPRTFSGLLDVLASIARWPVAVVLLGVAVGLLVRYAPAEHPEPRWASLGSAAIVGSWLLLSAGFGFWVTTIATYKSAAGTLAAFLVLTAYVLALSTAFVAGAELDEELRRRQD